MKYSSVACTCYDHFLYTHQLIGVQRRALPRAASSCCCTATPQTTRRLLVPSMGVSRAVLAIAPGVLMVIPRISPRACSVFCSPVDVAQHPQANQCHSVHQRTSSDPQVTCSVSNSSAYLADGSSYATVFAASCSSLHTQYTPRQSPAPSAGTATHQVSCLRLLLWPGGPTCSVLVSAERSSRLGFPLVVSSAARLRPSSLQRSLVRNSWCSPVIAAVIASHSAVKRSIVLKQQAPKRIVCALLPSALYTTNMTRISLHLTARHRGAIPA